MSKLSEEQKKAKEALARLYETLLVPDTLEYPKTLAEKQGSVRE